MTTYNNISRNKPDTATGIKNSYMITNRKHPELDGTTGINSKPLDGDTLWFYQANTPYDRTYGDYSSVNDSPKATMPTSFKNDILSDIQTTRYNGKYHLTLYIHGLGNTFEDAVEEGGQIAYDLHNTGKYPGLVLGFSWPSYNIAESGLYYAKENGYPSPGPYGTIRDNIAGSLGSFQSLICNVLAQLQLECEKKGTALSVNIICHSEGNYMLMRGLGALKPPIALFINQVMLLAADINNAALNKPEKEEKYEGTGENIARLSKRVTIYYSQNDPDIILSNLAYYNFHNPKFPIRLGHSGPNNYYKLFSNVIGLDCSRVVNDANVIALLKNNQQEKSPRLTVPPSQLYEATTGTYGPYLHSSYRYIPQVLKDMTALMLGLTPMDRGIIENTNGQGFMVKVL